MEKYFDEKLIIKNFPVEIQIVKVDEKLKSIYVDDWYCAYVDFPYALCGEYSHETFREEHEDKVTIGVDTAHYYNTSMTLEEKKQDAIKQITSIIDEHLEKEKLKDRVLECNDNNLKSEILELKKEIEDLKCELVFFRLEVSKLRYDYELSLIKDLKQVNEKVFLNRSKIRDLDEEIKKSDEELKKLMDELKKDGLFDENGELKE